MWEEWLLLQAVLRQLDICLCCDYTYDFDTKKYCRPLISPIHGKATSLKKSPVKKSAVAASSRHTVLLRSDGSAIACGDNFDRRCDIPALPEAFIYTKVAAGSRHTVLLRPDGSAIACGDNDSGQCNIPALPGALTYTKIAAGAAHKVLLRSDCSAIG